MKIGESLGLSENIVVVPEACAKCGKTKPEVEHATINPNYHKFESATSANAWATPPAEGSPESAPLSSSSRADRETRIAAWKDKELTAIGSVARMDPAREILCLHADVARLSLQLHEAQQERDGYKRAFDEELSGAGVLRKQFGARDSESFAAFVERLSVAESSLSSQLALLRAGDEPGVWPCGCQARVDALGVPTPLENDARCEYHLGLSSQLAGMREALEWALGERGTFPPQPLGSAGKRARLYWWRSELRKRMRAALSAAQAPKP